MLDRRVEARGKGPGATAREAAQENNRSVGGARMEEQGSQRSGTTRRGRLWLVIALVVVVGLVA